MRKLIIFALAFSTLLTSLAAGALDCFLPRKALLGTYLLADPLYYVRVETDGQVCLYLMPDMLDSGTGIDMGSVLTVRNGAEGAIKADLDVALEAGGETYLVHIGFSGPKDGTAASVTGCYIDDRYVDGILEEEQSRLNSLAGRLLDHVVKRGYLK